jgi:adenylosuccinate synthase
MIKFNKNSAGGICVVTTDAGAGSSGKGSLNAWVADKYGFDVAINGYMTNAGHFVELDDGTRILNQHLCSAFVDRNTKIYLNPGAAIDIQTLTNEIELIEKAGFSIKDRLFIHPLANVIVDADKEEEKRVIKSGSTFKGCGASIARKVMRVPGSKLARDYEELRPYIKDMTVELNEGLAKGMKILIEGSQGIDLDINFAEYPHTTSRQCHTTQLVADSGLSCQAVTNIILNVRTNPIRINNQSAANPNETCYTGNYWDAKEISWEDIARRAGYDKYEDFYEEYRYALFTSVTKKLRRVFEFPIERAKYVHALSGGLIPDSHVLYSLNFVNFIDRTTKGKRTINEVMTPKIKQWLDNNLFAVIRKDMLKWIRTGPKHSEIVELE